MATFKRISDNAVAWEYYKAGLLWADWASGTEPPQLRRPYPGDWLECDWLVAEFDGLVSMRNYICVEDCCLPLIHAPVDAPEPSGICARHQARQFWGHTTWFLDGKYGTMVEE